MVVSIKFQFEDDCRRRSLDNVTFEALIEHVKESFPFFTLQDFQLRYKDDENTWISVSTDQDLSEAFSVAKDMKKILNLVISKRIGQEKIIQTENKESNEIVHPGITCDGCNSHLKGIRYKCTVCHDFDLCSSCEGEEKHPQDHPLLKIIRPFHRHAGVSIRRYPSSNNTPLTSCPLVRLVPATKLVPPPTTTLESNQEEKEKEKEKAPEVYEEPKEESKEEPKVELKKEESPTIGSVEEDKYLLHLKTLKELGFTNEELLRKLLSEHNNDLLPVIDILLS